MFSSYTADIIEAERYGFTVRLFLTKARLYDEVTVPVDTQ